MRFSSGLLSVPEGPLLTPKAVPILERGWTPEGRRNGSLPLSRERMLLPFDCPFTAIGSIRIIPVKMKMVMKPIVVIIF
jgi:hypothetical protein